jgi:transcriptional regulator with XRE-family HTH domain
METLRKTPPLFPPDAHVRRLRSSGWTLEQIAAGVAASIRQVYRWASGDSRPMALYAALLAKLPDAPPKKDA